MTEDARQRLGVHAACQRVGGEGVAQVVEADVGQTRALEDALHVVVSSRGIHGLVGMQRVREDPLRERGLLPLAQQLRCARRETDYTLTGVGLGVAADERAVFTLERAAHMKQSLRLVVVLPAERADFAAPQSRGQLRVEEVVPVLVAFESVHQRIELRVVENLLLRAAALRKLYAVRGVCGNEPRADGGVERLPEQTEDAAHHRLGKRARPMIETTAPAKRVAEALYVGGREVGEALLTEARDDVVLDHPAGVLRRGRAL